MDEVEQVKIIILEVINIFLYLTIKEVMNKYIYFFHSLICEDIVKYGLIIYQRLNTHFCRWRLVVGGGLEGGENLQALISWVYGEFFRIFDWR